MRTGHTNIIRKEHECFWFDGANGDPLAGLLCLHEYRPESPVEDRLIAIGSRGGCC